MIMVPPQGPTLGSHIRVPPQGLTPGSWVPGPTSGSQVLFFRYADLKIQQFGEVKRNPQTCTPLPCSVSLSFCFLHSGDREVDLSDKQKQLPKLFCKKKAFLKVFKISSKDYFQINRVTLEKLSHTWIDLSHAVVFDVSNLSCPLSICIIANMSTTLTECSDETLSNS